MANTPRMQWPFPSADAANWYQALESFANAQDASAFAAREDRNVRLTAGGEISFTESTGVVTWSQDLEIPDPITGFLVTIPANSVTIADGQYAYITIPRRPLQNVTAAITVAGTIPSADDTLVLFLRKSNTLYFREGQVLRDGERVVLFDEGKGAILSYVDALVARKDKLTGYHEVAGGSSPLLTEDGTPITGAQLEAVVEAGATVNFVAILYISGGALTQQAGCYLYNLSTGNVVTSSQITGVTATLDSVERVPLTIGAAADEINLTENVYEVRLTNSSGDVADIVHMRGAWIEIIP